MLDNMNNPHLKDYNSKEMLYTYESLMAFNDIGYAILDKNGNILETNDIFLNIIGALFSEVYGSNIKNFIKDIDCEKFNQKWRKIQNGIPAKSVSLLLSHKQRTFFVNISASKSQISDKTFMIIQDLTENQNIKTKQNMKLRKSIQEFRETIKERVNA